MPLFRKKSKKEDIDPKEINDLIGRMRRIQEDIERCDDERERQGMSTVYQRARTTENAVQPTTDDVHPAIELITQQEHDERRQLEYTGPVINEPEERRQQRDEKPEEEIDVELEEDWTMNEKEEELKNLIKRKTK